MKDLSHMMGDIGAALIGGESMSGGNTVNDPATTVGAAPGSEPLNRPLKGPNSKADAPDLEVPSSSTKHEGVKSSSSVTSSDAIWKKV